jgi:hypothetical protein
MGYRDTYDEKLALTKQSLIAHCRKRITDNWQQMFDMWLSCEADMEFSHAYEYYFKEHFGKYISSEIKSNLMFAGSNILFALVAFMRYKGDADLEDILHFTEHFITSQFDDFDNWCEEIHMTMYEESSECARDEAADETKA